jgi:hypothetical protein
MLADFVRAVHDQTPQARCGTREVNSGNAMRLKQYSRVLVLVCGSFVVVALNYRLVSTGHYRLPLLVFAAFVIAIALLSRKLPPSTASTDQTQRNLLRLSSGLRRLGLLGAVGFVVYVLTSSRSDFQGIPTWGIVLLYVWGAFVVGCYFWGARWYKRKADSLSVAAKKNQGT